MRPGRLLPLGFGLLLMAGWLFGGDGTVATSVRLQGPSLAHLLGTDELGRDLLQRCWLGGARSLTLGLGLTALHLGMGGALAWLVHGRPWPRRLLLAFADLLASIPATLLALLLLALLRPGWTSLLWALAIGGWIPYARLALNQLDILRQDPSLVQAELMGGQTWHRLRWHLAPRVSPVLFGQATVGLGAVILVEGGLSFLGVGLPPHQASWGTMLNAGRAFLLVSPWGLLWPSLGMVGVLLAAGSLRREGVPS